MTLMVKERGVCRVLVGKSEGKRPLGRPRRRWVDNITMDLQEVGCGYVDWIGLAQDRDKWRTLVSAVLYIRVPWNEGNFLTSCKWVSCLGRTLHLRVSNWYIYKFQQVIYIIMEYAETFAPSAYFGHPETSLSCNMEASPPNIIH